MNKPNVWDKLFKQAKFRWKHFDDILELCRHIQPFPEHGKVLDLGCGTGRISEYLHTLGFSVVSVDESKTAIVHARKLLDQMNPHASNFLICDMHHIPFSNQCFDGVVSINTVYHTLFDSLLNIVHEIDRILKPNGFLIVTLQATQDYKYKRGIRVSNDTWICQDGPESGQIHTFLDKKQIFKILSNFKINHLSLFTDISKYAPVNLENRTHAMWRFVGNKIKKN